MRSIFIILFVFIDPADDAKYHINPSLVNRRGIYKDVFGSSPDREWADYQFRCNFAIAMVVAPDLFDRSHALGSLKLADKVLRSPLGMKTLYPVEVLSFEGRAKGMAFSSLAVNAGGLLNQFAWPIALADIGWKT